MTKLLASRNTRCVSRSLRVALAVACVVGCAGESDTSTPETVERHLVLKPGVIIESSSADTLLFETVTAVDVDTSGAVFVADAGTNQVVVISAHGEPLYRMGKEGAGPGEFQKLRAIAVRGNRIAVFDEGQMRVSTFNRTTQRLEDSFVIVNATAGGLMGNAAQMRFTSDSTLMVGIQVTPRMPNDSSVDELREYGVNGQLLRTQRIAVRQPALHRFHSAMGREGELDLPFTPWTVWTINPQGGPTIVWGAEYSIAEFNANGRVTQTIKRENAAPRPIDPLSMRLAKRWADGMLAAFGATPAGMRYVLPHKQQQVVALSYSPDGQFLWVKRTDFSPDPTYDVFRGDRFKCSVTLHAEGYKANLKQNPIRIAQGIALETAVDSLGNTYVLGYYLNTPQSNECWES